MPTRLVVGRSGPGVVLVAELRQVAYMAGVCGLWSAARCGRGLCLAFVLGVVIARRSCNKPRWS